MPALSHIAPINYSGQLAHVAQLSYEGYRLAHRAPIDYSAVLAHTAQHGLNAGYALGHIAPFALTQQGQKAHVGRYDLLAGHEGRVRHLASWSLLQAVVTTVTQVPYLVHDGQRIEIGDASVSMDEGGQFWTVRVEISKPGDYARLARLDAVILNIRGDEYALVIESLNRSRASVARQGGGTDQRFEAVCRSVLWATLGDDAPRITRTWDDAATARAVVEELAGESVDWRILDWTIPAGRLAAVNESAIGVISRIVAAAGGVVESAIDGTLICRYRYPVSIPDVAGTAVDHELSEAAGIISLSERMDAGVLFDRLTLSDATDGQGYLAAERDPDQQDTIFGGEQQKFLVYFSPDVEVSEILLSDGTLIDLGETDIEVEDEEVTFSNTNEARAARPVRSGFAYTWYGTGLGALTVGADGLTLRAASAGVGVARVSYTTRARRYAVLAPATSGGEAEFPVAVHVIGALVEELVASGNTALRIIVQRGAGALAGDDIIEPLAGNANVLLNRGRNEIDGAAAKAIVTIENDYQNGETGSGMLLPGQLVKAEDTQIGATWRGKVSGIEHRFQRGGVSSLLTVERFLT